MNVANEDSTSTAAGSEPTRLVRSTEVRKIEQAIAQLLQSKD